MDTSTTTTAPWHSPDGKADRIKAIWGDNVPDYLWYAVLNPLTKEQQLEIIALVENEMFAADNRPDFGSIEWHFGKVPATEGKTELRVRGADKLLLSLEIKGVTLPLHVVGHKRQPATRIDFTA